ncbi:TonB-dependent receptor [Asticcacaulis sp. YBE204]|uniref:TonB-dependent receptor n=1 Tax=Asticcacaulis sp. YBE204 TaxID=1282363 RepID=UPI0003C3D3E2|nr:TonB-dependent receptor [Asticcacaulis sp. YBE204]ESQ81092.1 hypothetical protein AEYBE204_01820 [Asticcacaulis sp. YBE204]
MKSSRLLCLTAVSLCLPVVALAQATAPKPDSKAEVKPTPEKAPEKTDDKTDPTTVTVKGQRNSLSGEKEVYDVTKNPDAATGTAQDALNKVPGVSVDPDGNVSLRGRSARVFINGRPSLMMSGDNRGAALQSMPSASISSIEVISNPGAQYSSSSNEPIINIVTKRNMPPGKFGTVSGMAVSNGGLTGNGFLSYTKGKFSLMSSAFLGNNHFDSTSQSQTEGFDASGNKTRESRGNGESASESNTAFLMSNMQYDLGDNDTLTGGLTYNRSKSDSQSLNDSSIFSGVGVVTDQFSSRSQSRFDRENGTLTFGYTHYGKKPDQSFKVDGSLSRTETGNNSDSLTMYHLGARPDRATRREAEGSNTAAMLQIAYNTTFGNTQVSVGTQFNHDDNRSDSLSYGPDASGTGLVLQPLLTNDLRYEQNSSAVYATAQRQFGPKWTILAGLRAEYLDLDTSETRTGSRNHIDYGRLNPSLFATYALSKNKKIRLSYTHKQQRPDASDLNPRLVYVSATSVNLGNPDLGPQESDNIEATYEVSGTTTNYSVRGFLRTDDDMIVTSSRIIPDPQNLGNLVTQTTRVNGGYQRQAGVTVAYSRRWDRKLTLNLDATVALVDLKGPNIIGTQSETTFGAGMSLNYTFKNTDTISINYKILPYRYTGQGYSETYAQGTVFYRHKLTPKLDLVISVQEPLKMTKTVSVTEGPLLKGRFVNERDVPIVSIGFSRRFGGFTAAPVQVKKP